MDFGFGGNMNISYTPGAPARRNSLAVWQAVAAAAAASSVWQFGVWQLIGIAVMLYLKLMLPRLSLQIPRSNTHISDGGMSSCNTRRNKWTKCKKYFQSIKETRILEALIYQLKLIVLTINVSDFIRDSVVVFFFTFFLDCFYISNTQSGMYRKKERDAWVWREWILKFSFYILL